MKFNAYLCSFIAIIFNLLIITNSAYLFSSDLQFNIPESFKANFATEADFEQFLKDLIHKLKLRIAEKLYQSFKTRNKIKQNLIKINATSLNKTAESLEKINDVSHDFHDYVKRIENFEQESFEKMIIQLDESHNNTGNAIGKLSETNKNMKKTKTNESENKDKEKEVSNLVENKNEIWNSSLSKEDYEADSLGCDFEEFDIEAKRNASDRSASNVFINNQEDEYDDEEENYENDIYKGLINKNASEGVDTDLKNKTKQTNNFNTTESFKVSSNPNKKGSENNKKNKTSKKELSLRNNVISNLNEENNQNRNFYFYENESLLNSNKSFYDFSNVFFTSDKNFQMKIFGKRLIDFFSSDKLNLNDNLLDSFYKFYLNLKIDKKAIEDKQYSLLKKEVDFFSLLEKGKSPGSMGNNLKSLKNNRIIKDPQTLNPNKNESFLFDTTTLNNTKNNKKIGSKNKLKLLTKNETLSSILNKNESQFADRNSKSQESVSKPNFEFSAATSNRRKIKIYIDPENECDVFFEDKVYYEADNFTNYFLDHIIINRKSNFIEPRGVKANNASIKYFVFNRKLNMFSIDIDKKAEQNFSVNYDYVAFGLIGVMTNDVFMNPDLDKNLNLFRWKVYNENTENTKLNLDIEIYFGLGQEYDYSKIKFNHAFAKREKNFKDKNITYFSWNGELLPYEVMTINSFFPMIFKNCGMEKLNVSLIILGSLFVILVIISLYLMIVNIIKDFY